MFMQLSELTLKKSCPVSYRGKRGIKDNEITLVHKHIVITFNLVQ